MLKHYNLLTSVFMFSIFFLPGIVSSAKAQPLNLNTFSPNTTINSSQVNQNFTNLSNTVPKMKSVGTAANIVLNSQTQNLTSVTVTPPDDGMVLLLVSLDVTMSEGGNEGGQSWGTISARLCITPMNTCSALMLDMPPVTGVQPFSPRLMYPATFMAMAPATKGVAATYNLTGQKDYADPGGSIIVSGTLLAIFIKMGL